MANSVKTENKQNLLSNDSKMNKSVLPKRKIDIKHIGRKSINAIKKYVDVDNLNDLIMITIGLGLKMPLKKEAAIKKIYKFWAVEINKDIDYTKEQKEEQEQINKIKRKIERKKKIDDSKSKKKDKSNTVVLDFNSDNLLVSLDKLGHFYKGLAKLHKEGRNINVYKKRIGGGQELEFNENFRIAFNYRFTNKMSNDFKNIFTSYIQLDSDTNKIKNDTDYKIYMNVGQVVKPVKMKQYFKQGTTNCFFKPIMEWASDKLENAKSKGTKDRYNSIYNKLVKDNDKYFSTGVSEEDMNFLSNKYQINIEVNTPFQKSFIIVKSNKKALTTFRFINTKLQHIDHNKIVNLESQEVEQDEINKLAKQLIKDDEYFTYNKNSFGYSKISTLNGSYTVKTDYHKCICDFEKNTGLINCYLDDIDDEHISEFVRQGTHFNETIDFKDDIYSKIINEDECEFNNKYSNFNHIDMSKAYSNFHLSKYYKGFLGRPTDLRRCDREMGLGYYKIVNVDFENATPLLKEYNEKMNIYNDNVYPSPELQFLRDHNVSFDIVAGCWGVDINFRFTNEMIHSKKKYPDEPSWYARYTGSMFCKKLYKNFYVKGDVEMAEHLRCYEDVNDIVDFNEYNNEIQVSYKKQHNNHLSHICGFITSYMRLNVMEQLLNMNPNNIIKVVVDGIYYMGDTETFNCFTEEKKNTITMNTDSGSYISNNEYKLCIDYAKPRDHYLKELHKGVGGSGKTHLNIYDDGLLRKLFVAPSWKLSRNKNKECGIDNEVWANLLSDDVEKINYFKRKYNTLILDEISMMTNSAKEKIFKTFCDCKIIFCGDPGYQLPQFVKGEKPIKLTGFDNVITYTKNRRCKCPKLLEILTLCRDNIENPNLFNIVKKLIPTITQEELKKTYTTKDMILTRSVENRNLYSKLLSDSKKYYVLKTDRIYCKGEILYNKPNDNYKEVVVENGVKKDGDYELRNAYTIHSIQGETAKNKLYIHNSYMEATAVYTALSRAEYLHQINLII